MRIIYRITEAEFYVILETAVGAIKTADNFLYFSLKATSKIDRDEQLFFTTRKRELSCDSNGKALEFTTYIL